MGTLAWLGLRAQARLLAMASVAIKLRGTWSLALWSISVVRADVGGLLCRAFLAPRLAPRAQDEPFGTLCRVGVGWLTQF